MLTQEPVTQLRFEAPLLQEASTYVLRVFNSQQDSRLVFHNYGFALDWLRNLRRLPETDDLPATDLKDMELAALFYVAGFAVDHADHVQQSLLLARDWLSRREVDPARQEAIFALLRSGGQPDLAHSLPELLLGDAYLVIAFLQHAEQRYALRKLEHELLGKGHPSRREWAEWWLDRLLGLRLRTHGAQTLFASDLAEAIKAHKRRWEKLQSLPDERDFPQPHLFDHLEDNPPLRAAQTYFRANYRNHINLSSIADNKANIMISVNSILISIIITLLTWRNITQTNPMVIMPAVIFVLTGLVSLVFAILSARPKVTQLNPANSDPERVKRNIMFFGNFVQLPLETYEQALDAVLRDGELLYGNMARDIYHLGKVLDKKYRYLTLSYNIFMGGLITSVLSFLILLIL
jgi:hypothetical protein